MKFTSENIAKVANEIRIQILKEQGDLIAEKIKEQSDENGKIRLETTLGIIFRESQYFSMDFTTRLLQALADSDSDD